MDNHGVLPETKTLVFFIFSIVTEDIKKLCCLVPKLMSLMYMFILKYFSHHFFVACFCKIVLTNLSTFINFKN